MRVTTEEKDLVFEIAQGKPHVIQFIGHLRVICQDAKSLNYMNILRWMHKNKMVGDTLLMWIKEKHQGSLLNAIANLRQKAESESKVRKILGKSII